MRILADFCGGPDLADYLQPFLGKVSPVVLECTIYKEGDPLWLDADADNASV